MTLVDLVALLSLDRETPPTPVSGVTEDSRRVRPGFVFVAVSGEKADGHDHAAAAAAAGAIAVLGERTGISALAGLPYFRYDRPRRAVALIAHALTGHPTREQRVLGVTGTNGKTSVVCLVQRILECAGHRCAAFGTLGYDTGDARFEAHHTTPFGEDLAPLFRQAADTGRRHVVMEVSSHALDQERVAGINFCAAAFTNLTQDHLDYHADMETYLRAKLKLFELVRDGSERRDDERFTVVNQEDPVAERFAAVLPKACFRFGDGGAVRAEDVRLSAEGAVFRLVSPWGSGDARIMLAGRHNVMNALCAAALCGGSGVEFGAIIEGLAALEQVPGRFTSVLAGQPFPVIVDYAHTDDGLRNALIAARALCRRRVIVVFGCGGDRDRGKRPKMGAVAATLADFAVVTSDNPRTEDPCRILLDVEVGLQRHGKRKSEDYWVIESRREAIAFAISLARPDDLVLIAGKGHEDYQIIGTGRHHFDDREEATKAIKALSP